MMYPTIWIATSEPIHPSSPIPPTDSWRTQPPIIKCSMWVIAPNNYFMGMTITFMVFVFFFSALGWSFGPPGVDSLLSCPIGK
ncbi:hypothetical protein SAMN05216411_10434 [Nitrosospira multiformis]|nr:hypothetical protein SAMN05216411_10434 [Nitrosospira multiformis]